jgi:hypothetical protein
MRPTSMERNLWYRSQGFELPTVTNSVIYITVGFVQQRIPCAFRVSDVPRLTAISPLAGSGIDVLKTYNLEYRGPAQ